MVDLVELDRSATSANLADLRRAYVVLASRQGPLG
jgi:hypothetical protein